MVEKEPGSMMVPGSMMMPGSMMVPGRKLPTATAHDVVHYMGAISYLIGVIHEVGGKVLCLTGEGIPQHSGQLLNRPEANQRRSVAAPSVVGTCLHRGSKRARE